MLDEKDIEALEKRLDMRYKQISDCNSEMDSMRRENTQIVADMSAIKTSLESIKWLVRTTLAAIIGGIVAGVFAIIKLIP